MPDALSYLASAGLTMECVAGKLRASPADRLTPEIRAFITGNKNQILAEIARQSSDEKTQNAGADNPTLRRQRHDEYLNHIMGRTSNCCYAKTGRYCPEGQRLWDAYNRTFVKFDSSLGELHG